MLKSVGAGNQLGVHMWMVRSLMSTFPLSVNSGVHNAKAEECTTPYMRQNKYWCGWVTCQGY